MTDPVNTDDLKEIAAPLTHGHPLWGNCDCPDQGEHARRTHEVVPYTKVVKALLDRAEAAEAKVKALEEVVEQIRALSSKDALMGLIDEAHAPRSHPDYPDRLVERHSPTAYIEGYMNALLKVTERLNAAALSRLQATEGEDA